MIKIRQIFTCIEISVGQKDTIRTGQIAEKVHWPVEMGHGNHFPTHVIH